MLRPHLDRTALLQGVDNEAMRRDILTTIIEVEYPVPLLKAGIELVDLPGHAPCDPIGGIIFPFMPPFLAAYRPHGFVFCFTTAAFEISEQHALTSKPVWFAFTGGAAIILNVGAGITWSAWIGGLAKGWHYFVLLAKPADADYKKLVAQSMLDSLCEPGRVEEQRVELERVLREKAEEVIERHRTRVRSLCAQRLGMIKACPEDKYMWLKRYWSEMRFNFGQLIAETLEQQDHLLHDQPVLLKPPVSASALQEGMWNGRIVYTKVTDFRKCSKDEQREFFEDLYHWLQMAQSSRHVLPLCTVFRQEPNTDVWCVVCPRFTCTLKEHLERHIATMKLADSLAIAKTIISAIKDIHRHRSVHANLRLETVVLFEEAADVRAPTAAVAGFSAVMGDIGSIEQEPSDAAAANETRCCCSTGRGLISPNADVGANRLFCSPKVDIFAFGVILSELTPKPKLLRCLATTGVAPQMATARGTPRQLVDLIGRCVATDPAQRPTALQVLDSLTAMCASPVEMQSLDNE
ncbi:hypothetical protein Pelo_9354 [Pelomyxa schiedti]|nr:hypothetical protein Pelo_9354 [Pelomyxa schiedti]